MPLGITLGETTSVERSASGIYEKYLSKEIKEEHYANKNKS
jgi:hypothetical protein